eukprot:TRINITY_DN4149_c0_g2_i2.p1 TRINITY_DN4149_c0_g2~~TRINITY_DN4149_c0_g2_i2.p1  ORF type:complete len:265 (+),score=25.05 TRINITY_DN4149_c0_g2_i2:28-822(+)
MAKRQSLAEWRMSQNASLRAAKRQSQQTRCIPSTTTTTSPTSTHKSPLRKYTSDSPLDQAAQARRLRTTSSSSSRDTPAAGLPSGSGGPFVSVMAVEYIDPTKEAFALSRCHSFTPSCHSTKGSSRIRQFVMEQRKALGHSVAVGPPQQHDGTTATVVAQDDSMCVICRETDLVQEGRIGCKHRFCDVCILEWSKITNTCPLCKLRFIKIFKFKLRVRHLIKTNQALRPICNRAAEDIIALAQKTKKCPKCLCRNSTNCGLQRR